MTGRQRVGWRLAQGALRSAVAAAVFAAVPAFAGDVNATSTTLVWTRPIWRAGDAQQDTSLIQRLGLSARAVDIPYADDLDFNVSAWGKLELGQSSEDAADGDVDLAYVRARALDRRLALTLGRQMVVGGVARFLHLDGGLADAQVAGGFGVTAYGGLMVIPRFMAASGDTVVGGRLYWRQSFENELGVSAIQILDAGLVSRRDVGADGRWALTQGLALKASGIWSLVESRVADAQVALWWTATPDLQVGADVRRTAPDLYIPRSSIFSVFAEEERDAVGGMASWTVAPRLTLTGDYHYLRVEEGNGHDGTLRADWRATRQTIFGAQARVLSEPVNGYGSFRIFARHNFTDALALSADVDGTQLFEPVNGETQAVLGGATVSYAIARGWSANLSGYAGTTPFFSSRYEVIARVSYDGSQVRSAK